MLRKTSWKFKTITYLKNIKIFVFNFVHYSHATEPLKKTKKITLVSDVLVPVLHVYLTYSEYK